MEGRTVCSKCGRIKFTGILYSGGLCKKCHQEKLLSFSTEYIYKKVKDARPTIFQTFIHHKLKEATELKAALVADEVKYILINSHIPISLHKIFLRELNDLKLIERINMNQIKVL